MKTKLLFAATITLLSTGILKSQTLYVPGATGTTSGLGVSTVSGNVGIGTSSPSEILDVNGNLLLRNTSNTANAGAYIHFTSYSNNHLGPMIKSSLSYASGTMSKSKLILSSYWEGYKNELTIMNGNVGIGTASPTQKLTVSGGKIRLEDEINAYSNFIYASLASSNYRSGQMIESNGSINFGLNGAKASGFGFRWLAKDNSAINYFDDSNELMRLTFDGKLGIGTTNPGNYKLNVWGTIRAHEIVVNTTGADFVFEPTYQLMTLKDLENYLQANQHLPGIAPAVEMQENGVSAGEMQTKLLQKVEELTLYVIELKKENIAKDTQINEQKKILSSLVQEIDTLKTKIK